MKDRLRSDLTAAMKARDEVTVRTLRMALTSVTKEEVAGTSARELSDDEVLAVLTREAKRRREAAYGQSPGAWLAAWRVARPRAYGGPRRRPWRLPPARPPAA